MLILLVALTSFLITNAVKVDGTDNSNEWENAEAVAYVDNNNGVQVGILTYIVDGFDVYLRLQARDKSISSADTKAGFIVFVEGEEIFRINLREKSFTTNSDKYSVDAEISYYDNSGVLCEAKIGVKNGIGSRLNASVCFLDNDGIRSNVHPFVIINEAESTTTEKETERITDERTTKERTTKEKTTKEKTTKEKTTKEKTTKEKTTKEKTSKEKTTKIPTTKVADKTTTKNETTKYYFAEPSATVNYSEVTDSVTNVTSESNGGFVENETVSKVQYYFADTKNSAYNKGKAIKIAACAASGLGFVAVAVWACLKNKPVNSKNKEKVDEESDKD